MIQQDMIETRFSRSGKGWKMVLLLVLMPFDLLASAKSAQAGFSSPVRITQGGKKYRLSRTADNVMAIDSAGKLHVVYWSGSDFGTTPTRPSFVYYRTWSPRGGWSAEEQIDDSTVSGFGHLGGRHPSLALLPDGTVWVVWNDSRNATDSGNWIDNIEIYGDFRPPGGSFSPSDIRLTETSASHLGDNGYTPKIVPDIQGRLTVVWFDFHFNANVSDLFLKTSDANAVFNLTEPMDSLRLTDETGRGGVPSYTVPDLAVDSSGTRHIVWVGGFGAGDDLYYGTVVVGSPTVTEQVIASGGTDFLDPPHVTADPDDNIWVVYGDDSASAGENVVLLKKPSGQSSFDPPIVIEGTSARQYAPDVEVDADGIVHLVWVDETSGTHIRYARYDPIAAAVVESVDLTDSTGPWARPTLALDSNGNVFVLWEENKNTTQGDIWFATTATEYVSSIDAWGLYN